MVAPGNHENEEPEKLPFISYQSRFLMPFNRSRATEGNLYWSMDISFAHIVCLSTESNFDTKSRQYKWLLQDLQSVDRIETPWIIIMFHRPIYNSNYGKLV